MRDRIFRIHRWDTEQYAELHRFAPAAHLALVDDDPEYRGTSPPTCGLDIEVQTFADSNELLAHTSPFSFNFYIPRPDAAGRGRRRADPHPAPPHAGRAAGGVGRLAPDVFSSVVDAGADMHLAKPASFDQVVVAIRAVHRRVTSYSGSSGEWLLDRQAGRLIAPDGVRIDLSDLDLAVMERFVQAEGQAVTRESLCHHLGRPVSEEPTTRSARSSIACATAHRTTPPASPVPLRASRASATCSAGRSGAREPPTALGEPGGTPPCGVFGCTSTLPPCGSITPPHHVRADAVVWHAVRAARATSRTGAASARPGCPARGRRSRTPAPAVRRCRPRAAPPRYRPVNRPARCPSTLRSARRIRPMSMLAVRVGETRSMRTRERLAASRSPEAEARSAPTSASRGSSPCAGQQRGGGQGVVQAVDDLPDHRLRARHALGRAVLGGQARQRALQRGRGVVERLAHLVREHAAGIPRAARAARGSERLLLGAGRSGLAQLRRRARLGAALHGHVQQQGRSPTAPRRRGSGWRRSPA